MATSPDSGGNNLKAGLFTILSIVLGFLTIMVLNSTALQYLFGNYNQYQVRFDLQDGVSGLSKGSEVRVGGLVQGRVTGIKLVNLELNPPQDGDAATSPVADGVTEPPSAIVLIEMDAGIKLWSNAVAIRTVPILGGAIHCLRDLVVVLSGVVGAGLPTNECG